MTAKEYELIAQARKQPISWIRCHFVHQFEGEDQGDVSNLEVPALPHEGDEGEELGGKDSRQPSGDGEEGEKD